MHSLCDSGAGVTHVSQHDDDDMNQCEVSLTREAVPIKRYPYFVLVYGFSRKS